MSSDELFARAIRPLTSQEARGIIGAFHNRPRYDNRYFYDFMVGGRNRLNPATRTGDTLVMGTTRNTLFTDAIGKGASGDIYKSTSNEIVYKKLVIRKGDEHEARELFIETFIPCLLSVCEGPAGNFGQYICKTLAVYRDGPTTDDLNKDTENQTAIALREQAYRDFQASRGRQSYNGVQSIIMYIKMEYTLQNAYEFFDTFFSKEQSKENIYKIVLRFIRDIAFALWGLDQCYQFRHRDLHLGNITFSKTRQIKIIDFGRCSLVHNGQTYGKDYYKTEKLLPCYDLLTLLVSFNCSFRDYPYVKELIENGLLMHNSGESLYTISANKTERDPSLAWHYTYPQRIEDYWTEDEKKKITETLTVSELESNIPAPEQLEIIKRIDGILDGRVTPAGQRMFKKIPMSQKNCPSWCTWLTCGCLRRRGGTRKRTNKKHNKKGKTKRSR